MSERTLSVSAVLPAFNEEDALPHTIPELAGALEALTAEWEIVVADDGSTDGTPDVCARFAEEYDGRVRTVRFPSNRGYGAALAAGIQAARHDYTFLMDSDGQFEPTQLGAFLARLPEARAVIGFRLNRIEGLRRKFVSAVFNQIVRIVFRVRARDVDCAFRIYESGLLRAIPITCQRYLVNTEMQHGLRRLGVHPVQLGVAHRARLGGVTKIGLKDVPLSLLEIVKLRWRLWGGGVQAVAESTQPSS